MAKGLAILAAALAAAAFVPAVAAQRGAAEEDAGHLSPVPPTDVFRRVVAEHEDIEVVDCDSLGATVRSANFLQVRIKRLVLWLGRRMGTGADVVVRIEREVARADEPRFVAAIDGRHREPCRGVRRRFGFHLVNNKADFHGRLINVVCSWPL